MIWIRKTEFKYSNTDKTSRERKWYDPKLKVLLISFPDILTFLFVCFSSLLFDCLFVCLDCSYGKNKPCLYFLLMFTVCVYTCLHLHIFVLTKVLANLVIFKDFLQIRMKKKRFFFLLAFGVIVFFGFWLMFCCWLHNNGKINQSTFHFKNQIQGNMVVNG